MNTLARFWAATQAVRHAVAGGIVAALVSAYSMGADKPGTTITLHQWIGLALVFCTGAGLTKYVIPEPSPVSAVVAADTTLISPDRGVEPDPHAVLASSTDTTTA